MARIAWVLLACLALAGCATEDTPAPEPAVATEATAEPEPEPTVEEEAPAPAPADGAQTDLIIQAVDVNARMVTLANPTAADIDTAGMWICNRPSYQSIDGIVPAGGTLDIAFDAIGPESGEVALYTDSSFGASDSIVAYVQWGTGGGRESVAVDAGIWPEGERVDNGGASFSTTSSAPTGAADYSTE